MTPLSRSGPWYVFDYGMVISTAPQPADWAALEHETGLQLAPATSSYWTRREDFDAGVLEPAEYWARVLGGRALDDEQIHVLEELDAAQWSHLNPDTVEVLESLADEGARLALLSNMPAGMAERFLRESSWAGYFAKTFFSGQLGLLKPDRRIFAHVLNDLRTAPAEVIFVDDNLRNIEAARGAGVHTVHFGPGTDLMQALKHFSGAN